MRYLGDCAHGDVTHSKGNPIAGAPSISCGRPPRSSRAKNEVKPNCIYECGKKQRWFLFSQAREPREKERKTIISRDMYLSYLAHRKKITQFWLKLKKERMKYGHIRTHAYATATYIARLSKWSKSSHKTYEVMPFINDGGGGSCCCCSRMFHFFLSSGF